MSGRLRGWRMVRMGETLESDPNFRDPNFRAKGRA